MHLFMMIPLLALAGGNIFVSYRVVKSDYFSNLQKAVQCMIVWMIPVLGGALVYVFTREPSLKPRSRSFVNSPAEFDASSFADRIGD